MSSPRLRSPVRPSWTVAAWAVGVVVAVAGCGTGAEADRRQRAASGPAPAVVVVTAVGAYASLLADLGGERVGVDLLIEPGADPHDYEPTPADALAVGRADLVVVSGLDYDPFLPRLLDATPSDDRRTVTVAEVLQARPGEDPHLWYGVHTLPAVADALTAALVEVDPAGESVYRASRSGLTPRLERLQDAVTALGARRTGAAALLTEPVASRLLADAGIRDATPSGLAGAVQNGGDPTAADLAEARGLLRSGAVQALVHNTETQTPLTESLAALAADSGTAVVEVRESPGQGEELLAWLGSVVAELEVALTAAGR